MSEDLKVEVTDAETRTNGIAQLSDADKQELKRRALERRAVELLQPKTEPDPSRMDEQEFQKYKRSIGLA